MDNLLELLLINFNSLLIELMIGRDPTYINEIYSGILIINENIQDEKLIQHLNTILSKESAIYITEQAETSNNIVLNSVVINDGDSITNKKLVNININYTGSITRYRISEDPEILLISDWIYYTSEDIQFMLSNGSGLKTIYVQLKNGTNTSNIATDNIQLDIAGGIRRTDSSNLYDTYALAIAAIISDYPTGLTQDVTLYTVTEHIESLSGYIYIQNFNFGGTHSLIIDGSELTTFNANHNGVFYITDSDNIILKNFNIYSISNDWTGIEIAAGIKVKTEDESYISRLELRNISIDGRNWASGLFTDTALGAYGLSFSNIRSLVIDGCNINYFANEAISLYKVTSIYIKNLVTGNSTSDDNFFAHPTLLKVNTCKLFVMTDTDFNAEGMTNGINFCDTDNIIIKRVIFRNCPSQLIFFDGVSSVLNASFESCIFYNNIHTQYYYWTRGLIVTGTCINLSITNCTIRLNPINNSLEWPPAYLLWGGTVDTLNLYNNIYYYYNPSRTSISDNGRGMILMKGTINTKLNSNNNLYYDYSTDNNTIANKLFETNLITTSKLTELQSYGCDSNSIVKNLSVDIFESGNLDYNMFKLIYSSINFVIPNLEKYIDRDIDNKISEYKIIGAIKFNQTEFIPIELECQLLNLYDNTYTKISGSDVISIASGDQLIIYVDDSIKSVSTQVEILDDTDLIIHKFKQISYISDLMAKFINEVYSNVNYYSLNITNNGDDN